MIGLSQTILISGVFVSPYATETMMRSIGFRNTLWVFTGLAAICFVVVIVLDPVEKHMKKNYINDLLDDATIGMY